MDKLINRDAERGLVGALLLSPEQVTELPTLPEHFHSRALGAVYGEIARRVGIGDIAHMDAIALAQAVTASGVTVQAGDLMHLVTEIGTALVAPELAEVVTGLHKRRELVRLLGDAAKRAHDLTDDDIASPVMAALDAVTKTGAKLPEGLGEILAQVYDDVVARAKNPGDVWGIPTGLSRLDKLTGGLHAGELTILAGEPGVGKTWLALQMAKQAARYAPGVFLSLEMRRKEIAVRLLQLDGVNGWRLKTGYMQDGDWRQLTAGVAKLEGANLRITDGGIRLSALRPMLMQMQQRYGVRYYVLDYIMLVDAPGKDETEKTGNISRELKNICHDLGLAALAISSITKLGMAGGQINMSNLRGSGEQIHAADNIFGLTKYAPVTSAEKAVLPAIAERRVTLETLKGRGLEVARATIHLQRDDNTPAFIECQ